MAKIFTFRDVVLVRWNDWTVEGIKAAVAATVAAGTTNGNMTWSFYVVPITAPIPDNATRAQMSGILDTILGSSNAVCVVIEGKGMKYAAARAVAASFVLVAGRKLHIFGSLKEAVETLKVPDGAAVLAAALREGIIVDEKPAT